MVCVSDPTCVLMQPRGGECDDGIRVWRCDSPVGAQPAKSQHKCRTVDVHTWAAQRENVGARNFAKVLRICRERARNCETNFPPFSLETLIQALQGLFVRMATVTAMWMQTASCNQTATGPLDEEECPAISTAHGPRNTRQTLHFFAWIQYVGASSESPTDSLGDFPAISEKRLLSRS